MVSLFEVFYVFFINFHTLNLKIIPRFIHHVQFFLKLIVVLRVKDYDFTRKVFMLSNCTVISCCMYSFFTIVTYIFHLTS
jgi:exosortase/archaeosortase